MRVATLSATAALVLATLAGSVAPAAADTPAGPVLQVPLEAGNGLHHSTGSVVYERVDGEVNAVRIISVYVTGGDRDCAWLDWNDPHNPNGWSSLTSEPSCGGTGLEEHPDRIVKAPVGHPLKVRLAAYHRDSAEVKHKDIEKL
ncbi:hypothetical protein ACFYNM_32065 [Streptomyces spororaveus]|uniref:hypothetical protein n=1 Tax=Streptomyces spororaveus TaxID=284039 RepID=UPI0036A66405